MKRKIYEVTLDIIGMAGFLFIFWVSVMCWDFVSCLLIVISTFGIISSAFRLYNDLKGEDIL